MYFANKRRRLLELALLYASKSGAVIAGVIVLPFFNKMLGPEIFGLVAVVFTLQGFLITLDFGLSIVVGRNLAATDSTAEQQYTIWRDSELFISIFYATLFFPAFFISWKIDATLGPLQVIACLVLFWSLTLQNIAQSALLARKHYNEAALAQVLGVLARHGFSALALTLVYPSLSIFLYVQAVVAFFQMIATRWKCNNVLLEGNFYYSGVNFLERAKKLVHAGQSLMIFGLSGAAVMYLDKVIVSSLVSARDLTPYYFATTFCLVPISVLAAPIAQFFQPKIIHAVSAGESLKARRIVVNFNLFIVAFAILPAAIIWQFRSEIITLWLHGSPDVLSVVEFSTVLLPGVALGSLGYVPYTLLLAKQEYKYQALLSLKLTSLTLFAVVLASLFHNIFFVCVIYSVYHVGSAIASWRRCLQLDIIRLSTR